MTAPGDAPPGGGVLGWFASHSVAANLLMALIVIAGLQSIGGLPLQTAELYYQFVTVSVPYPGAGPEEVDEAVCARADESLRGLKAVRRTHSLAIEGLCYVRVYPRFGLEADEILEDVKARIDTIDSFPEDVERAVVQEYNPPLVVNSVVVFGQADEQALARLGERLRDEITALPGITLATLSGVRPYEISIEVSEADLRRYGLTFTQVAEAVRGSSLNLPGGSVKAQHAEISLRTLGQAYRRQDFEHIPLLSRPDGTRLLLRDVATVRDGFAESAERLLFDGEPAVQVDVFRVGSQDIATIADNVEDHLQRFRAQLPDGLEATIAIDETGFVRDRLGALLDNGRDGLILVLLVLTLFLRVRLASWVALGIPISFLGTLWGMLLLGIVIDAASLLGFILALGIVVDDAIVVGENVHRHSRGGGDPAEAATRGVREVAGPVLASGLSTIAAFAPMLALPGILTLSFRHMAAVLILCLGFSLVESLLILPAHLAHSTVGATARPGRLRAALDGLFDRLGRRWYRPILERALAWRASLLAAACALLIFTFGWVAGGHLPFFFFQAGEADTLTLGVTLPRATPQADTIATVRRIEDAVFELQRQLEEEDPGAIRHVLAQIGRLPAGGFQLADPGRLEDRGTHLGGVTVLLAASSQRTVSTADLGRRLLQLVGQLPDVTQLSLNTSVFAAGKAIDVELAGSDLDQLRRAAAELKTRLGGYSGVHQISDSLRAGKPELRISPRPEGEALGLDLREISRQLRQGFYGEEVQRLQRGRHELKVMVRLPESERRLATLESLRLQTPQGDQVAFASVGSVELARGLAAIERTDGRWTVRVSADVDRSQADGGTIVDSLRQSVLPELAGGLSYTFVGEQEEQRQTLGSLRRNTFLALFAIYAMLAVAANSYLQPFLVLAAIPFGVVGAIWGHTVMGSPLTMWSLIGMVALSGVVINDCLVLLDFVRRGRHRGLALREAALQAGEARLRPIILTSLTTFAGLTPLLFAKSVQAALLVPIAISLAFGILFSTVVTLFLLPVAYSLLEDAGAFLSRRRQRSRGESRAD